MTNRELKTIEYLNKYGEATRVIRRCEEEYQQEVLQIDAVRSLSANDGMPHGNRISRPTEDKAIRLADKLLRLVDARTEAVEVRREIYDVVTQIGGVESDVLFYRYVMLQGWKDVCNSVNYGWAQTHRYHKRGLNKIADIIGIE